MRTVERRGLIRVGQAGREPARAAKVLPAVGLAVVFAIVPMVVLLAMTPWLTGTIEARDLLVAKALVVTVGLMLVTYFSDAGRPMLWTLAIAAVGYLISPPTWVGRAYMAQLWYEPGIATVLFDLVAWLAVVLGTSVVVRQVKS